MREQSNATIVVWPERNGPFDEPTGDTGSMRTLIAYFRLLAFAVSALLCGCSKPAGLIGTWRTDVTRINLTGNTNDTVQGYQTAVFSLDGTFTITGILKARGQKAMAIPMNGTYKIIDTNHIRLEIVPNTVRPDMKVPLTVFFAIEGNQLEMDPLTSSVVAERLKYRRVRP